MLRILFLLIVLQTGLSAGAQQYNYLQYTVADGLPSNMIYDVQQDADGFIWVASDVGVARFDGRKFTTFTQQDGLPTNDIIVLYPDSKGRIWMIPMHNSICYYYKGKIHNYKNDSVLSKLRSQNPFMFVRENDGGDIIIAGSDFRTSSIFFLTKDDKLKQTKHPIPMYAHGGIAAGRLPHEFFFGYFDTARHKSDYYTYDGHQWEHIITLTSKKNSYYYSRYIMKNGVLSFMDSIYDVNCRNLVALPFTDINKIKFGIRPVGTKATCNTSKGRSSTFFSNGSGIYLVDTLTDLIIDSLLPGTLVNRGCLDKEGNIWLATHSKGLFMAPSRNIKSYTFPHGTANILTIFNKKEMLFAGNTEGNLYSIQGKGVNQKDFKEYAAFANNKGDVNRLRWIEPLPDNQLVLGLDNFLIKYDPLTGKRIFSRIDVTKSMAPAGKDSLLVATGRGTLLINSKDLTILDTIYPFRSYCCMKAGQSIYIGTPNGPVKITPGRAPYIMANAIPELQTLVNRISMDLQGNLWISTTGNGLFKMRNDTVVLHLNASNGLNSNNCKAMYLDGKFLWLGTEKGLNKINWQQPSDPVQQYSTEDGLASNDIHSLLSDNGKLYVGTAGKVSYFDTALIRGKSFCQLSMLNIESGDRIIHSDSLSILRYDENNLKFNFSATSFRSTNNIIYHYKLKGYSDNWNTTTNTNLEFLTLPYGDYQLQIFARNKFGVTSNTITIPFTITPPFWHTWWFRILVVGILIALVWWIVIRRIKQEQAKLAVQNHINELEQQALRSQMNPHFIFNCLNSIQNFLLQNNFEKTNEYLTSFAHLIRQTLDNSSRSSISIEGEHKYLSSYLELESMRFAHSFTHSIEVDPAIDPDNTHIPTMILQPYVENSIRHGLRYRQDGDKAVKVSFLKRGNTLVCIVEDNGVGRKKAGELKSFMHVEYQSKGMTLTADRIAALNRRQDIPITVDVIDLEENGNATGTQVLVRFPNVFL